MVRPPASARGRQLRGPRCFGGAGLGSPPSPLTVRSRPLGGPPPTLVGATAGHWPPAATPLDQMSEPGLEPEARPFLAAAGRPALVWLAVAWPARGGAQHPGPQAMLVDAGAMERERSPPRGGEQARVFCPVDGCPASNPRTARGWGSHAAMRPHLDDHAAGTLQGAIPAAYCAAHSLDHCRVCGLLVAARFYGAHPRCRPAAGTRQHLLRRQQLLATVVALIWPPFFWQTPRYFGTCPKSLACRGPNALPELWPR